MLALAVEDLGFSLEPSMATIFNIEQARAARQSQELQFPAVEAKRVAKRQRKPATTRAAIGAGRSLTAAQRQNRDDVRVAAKARL